ncbi:MAG TPA: hypothetical protein VGR96_11815 [Acidobacteriaceae bacterium]|nr:hypothetical protein [Acidobacteriaceae bacterium]
MRLRCLSILWFAIWACLVPALLVCVPSPLAAMQRQQRDVLTDQQTEDLRQADDDPPEKAKLYLGYLEERLSEIHRLNTDPSADRRAAEIHNLFEEFTRLSDELQDNLDSFEEQHFDLRKALKLIVEKSEKWPAALNEPKPNPEYEFSRKSALEAAQSLYQDTVKMLDDENQYFAKLKKDKKKGS